MPDLVTLELDANQCSEGTLRQKGVNSGGGTYDPEDAEEEGTFSYSVP